MLEINGSTFTIDRIIELRPAAKRMVDAEMGGNLPLAFAGDQAKVRINVPLDRMNEWPAEEERIRLWAKERGIELASIEPIVAAPAGQLSDAEEIMGDIEIFEAFARDRAIPEDLLRYRPGLAAGAPTVREISLVSLAIDGFKSFSSETQIDFSSNPGLYFLGGDNQVEPRLGANGAGKSSMWEALTWALTGASSKGRKASDLITWDGRKSMLVTVVLDVNGERHTIYRSSPPNRIVIDGKPVEQAELDALLGMSRGRFLQSVIFGQGAKLFYDLDNAARRRIAR